MLIIGALGFGGAERVICNLANYFSKQNMEVTLISIRNREPVYELDPNINFINGVDRSNKLLEILALRKLMKRQQPKIIISFLTQINIAVIFASIGLKSKVIVSERSNPYLFPTNKMIRFLRNVSYKFSNGFVFQTDDARNHFSKKIKEKSVVIPNPVDIDSNLTISKKKEKTIVTVGRLIPAKNMDLLIDAFHEVCKYNDTYNLKIYGDGPELLELNKKIVKLGIDHKAEILKSNKNILTEISESEIFVLTSNNEGMPNSLMEAMSIGLACISTDCPVGGPRSLIEDGINGFLIPVNSKDDLVEKLMYIIQNDKKRNEISSNAKNIRETHSINKIGMSWLDYVKEVDTLRKGNFI